jgi:ABC-type phosphate/phosphonate transport system substrate-binding protein
MIKLLSQPSQANYGVISFDIVEGTDQNDLLSFGKRLDSGDVHLGMVTGIEYGWLRKRYPKLRPLVIANVGRTLSPYSEIRVRKNGDIGSIDALQGKTIARVRRMSLDSMIYVNSLLQGHALEASPFRLEELPRPTLGHALAAIKNGDVDGVVISIEAFSRLSKLQPGIANEFIPIDRSDAFPTPVLIGRPVLVNQLRTGLWDDLGKSLLKVHRTAQGRQVVTFWGFVSFSPVSDNYTRRVRTVVKKYPISNAFIGLRVGR